jgi:hypothetical protein
MNILSLKKSTLKIVTMLAAVVMFASCGKDKDGPGQSGSYPKEVSIEYRVTTSSGLAKINISYTNETGGHTVLSDSAIPFTKKFKRTVNMGDDASVGVTSCTVKVEILVNDKVVKSEVFSGNEIISGSVIFPFI